MVKKVKVFLKPSWTDTLSIISHFFEQSLHTTRLYKYLVYAFNAKRSAIVVEPIIVTLTYWKVQRWEESMISVFQRTRREKYTKIMKNFLMWLRTTWTKFLNLTHFKPYAIGHSSIKRFEMREKELATTTANKIGNTGTQRVKSGNL